MPRLLVLTLVLAAFGTSVRTGTGGEPGKAVPMVQEPLPAPREIAPPAGNMFLPAYPPYVMEHGTRDVWMNYGVDRAGRWRPRVILAPYGSYYRGTLEPYPWTTTRPGSYLPSVRD